MDDGSVTEMAAVMAMVAAAELIAAAEMFVVFAVAALAAEPAAVADFVLVAVEVVLHQQWSAERNLVSLGLELSFRQRERLCLPWACPQSWQSAESELAFVVRQLHRDS